MRILLTFAVGAEFAPWRDHHNFTRIKVGDQILQRTSFGEAEVSVLLTGIGPRHVRSSLTVIYKAHAAEHRRFDACISVGLAGALSKDCKAGEVLAARSVRTETVRHDLRSDPIRSDPGLLALASQCGVRLVDSFCTLDRLVVLAKEKAELAATADAVEMESFEVMKESSAWGARCIAIRAVSDLADEDLPIDFGKTITPEGQVSPMRVLQEVMRHPGRIPALVRFARRSRRAAEALADMLDRFVGALGAGNLEQQIDIAEEVSAT
jgi:nucleoside phosphorylase